MYFLISHNIIFADIRKRICIYVDYFSLNFLNYSELQLNNFLELPRLQNNFSKRICIYVFPNFSTITSTSSSTEFNLSDFEKLIKFQCFNSTCYFLIQFLKQCIQAMSVYYFISKLITSLTQNSVNSKRICIYVLKTFSFLTEIFHSIVGKSAFFLLPTQWVSTKLQRICIYVFEFAFKVKSVIHHNNPALSYLLTFNSSFKNTFDQEINLITFIATPFTGSIIINQYFKRICIYVFDPPPPLRNFVNQKAPLRAGLFRFRDLKIRAPP